MTTAPVDILFQIVVFLFAISVHESAHAWTAMVNGDPTAYMLGRVTLNPLKHIDPVGTVLLPLIAMLTGLPVIGWAKPTPVNPRNFRTPVRSDILTSVAGPVSNLLVAGIAVVLLVFIALLLPGGRIIVHNLALGATTDTGSLLMPASLFLYETMFINVLLAIFNLIPVPPLDGSHVLRHLLPAGAQRAYDMAGMVGLVLLVLVGGRFIAFVLNPVVGAINALLMRV